MQKIKFDRKVTSEGIFIPFRQIKTFKDKEVEIVISENIPGKQKKFMAFAGKLSEDDANELLIHINDCRTIDHATWK